MNGFYIDRLAVVGVGLIGGSLALALKEAGAVGHVVGIVNVKTDVVDTLCGAGILFDTAIEGREEPFIFSTSGFLYRSNKLMYDRQTESLWNQFTGKPVSGALVDSGIELKQRPVVITTWGKWRAAQAGTKVLSVNTGYRRNYGSGVVYADYFGSEDLMFPAQVDQRVHKQKDYVFAVRQFGAARAWPLKAFEGRRVINDGIADTTLVLIGDATSRAVRASDAA